jgi:hypothetical protein
MPCNFEVNLITRLGVIVLFYIFLVHLAKGPCEVLPSLGVRRPSVNFFIYMALWPGELKKYKKGQ